MMQPKRNTMIDGLRSVAIFLVLFHHWTNVRVGQIGVQIFFVISGFLITGILLESRSYLEKYEITTLLELKNFYTRRNTLSIFRIYYLLLVVLLTANRYGVREDFGWYATYTANVAFF